MRVISVIGITESGKTTTIENIIKELKRRNYSVGSVKEIHYEEFQIDTEGSNTYRHKEAGSELVTARGYYETDILFQEKLSMEKILSFYNHDFVILEGVSESEFPKIITAHDIPGIEGKMDKTVFAISGRIGGEISQYKGLPVINSLTHIEDLVDLIEDKSLNKNLENGGIEEINLTIKIEGKEINLAESEKLQLSDFVAKTLRKTNTDSEIKDIDIFIKKRV